MIYVKDSQTSSIVTSSAIPVSGNLGLNTSVWTMIFNSSYIFGNTFYMNCEITTGATVVTNHVYDNVFVMPEGYRSSITYTLSATCTHENYQSAQPVACLLVNGASISLCFPNNQNKYVFISGHWRLR